MWNPVCGRHFSFRIDSLVWLVLGVMIYFSNPVSSFNILLSLRFSIPLITLEGLSFAHFSSFSPGIHYPPTAFDGAIHRSRAKKGTLGVSCLLDRKEPGLQRSLHPRRGTTERARSLFQAAFLVFRYRPPLFCGLFLELELRWLCYLP